MAEWMITLPTANAIEFLKLEILTSATIESFTVPTKPVYVAIGNSMTQGTGIDKATTRLGYPFIIADSLGFDLHNLGIGGSFIYDGVLDNLNSTVTPDFVTVLWGYNDVHYKDDNHFQTVSFVNYKKLLEGLAVKFPNACIMAILPLPALTADPNSVRTMAELRAQELTVIQNLQLTYSNIHYMDGSTFVDAATGINADKVHPNEKGNQDLAYGIIKEIPCNDLFVSSSKIVSEPFKVFPNPTAGIVNFSKEIKFKLLDVSGKLIFNGESKYIDISSLSKGIYYIVSDKGVYKIIKK